jgi:hypothetical protein
MASFARPADTNAYSAGDVVSDNAGTAKALIFPACGRGGLILSASLVVAHTVAADFDLLVFDNEPTNFADNAALALVAADQPRLLTIFRFLTASKINVGTNLEYYRCTSAGTDQAMPPVAYTNVAGFLYGLLVCRSAATPASGCKFTARLNLARNIA